MSPRSRRSGKRPYGEEYRPLDPGRIGSVPHSEVGPDGLMYQVRQLGPSSKQYTCPGCLQVIPIGTRTMLAWPEEAPFGVATGVDARRHWHVECWRRRLRPM